MTSPAASSLYFVTISYRLNVAAAHRPERLVEMTRVEEVFAADQQQALRLATVRTGATAVSAISANDTDALRAAYAVLADEIVSLGGAADRRAVGAKLNCRFGTPSGWYRAVAALAYTLRVSAARAA